MYTRSVPKSQLNWLLVESDFCNIVVEHSYNTTRGQHSVGTMMSELRTWLLVKIISIAFEKEYQKDAHNPLGTPLGQKNKEVRSFRRRLSRHECQSTGSGLHKISTCHRRQ